MHDRGRSARVARSIAACAIAVSAAALFWPQSAGAAVRSCKPVSVGPERVAPTEAEGKRLALSAWVDDVRKGHGAQFAGWAIAIDKTLSCRRGPAGSAGKDRRGGDFVCQARAAPCTILQVAPPARGPQPLAPARVPRAKALKA